MVVTTLAPAPLDVGILSLYHARDGQCANLPVFVFYGASTTTNSTQNSSRIQAHVYSAAGFQSFPRLTIAPTSPLYAAVKHLPSEKQGDEDYRGLAVVLLKYFTEMRKPVQHSLSELAALGRMDQLAPAMFDEMHAGNLAASMVRHENAAEVAADLQAALSERSSSWLDVDVVLPKDAIGLSKPGANVGSDDRILHDDIQTADYGEYTRLIGLLGSPTFLPTSKLRRAPSKPTAVSRTRTLAKEQKESLRREMVEFLDTEERYIGKIYELSHSVAADFGRKPGKQPAPITTTETATQQLFPDSLSGVLEANSDFVKVIRNLLERTEDDAIKDMHETTSMTSRASLEYRMRARDPTGTEAFAKALLEWFPRFREPYQDYLRASLDFSNIINQRIQDNDIRFMRAVNSVGEQRLRSWLIEPVQRLPRYSLFIDNMINLLPASHPAMSKFLRARDIVTDICSLDNDPQAELTRAAECLRELVSAWPSSLSPRGRLITAVDVVELKAPFRPPLLLGNSPESVLLLFADSVAVVRKTASQSLSARGILAEVDKPRSNLLGSPINGQDSLPKDLAFAFSFDLSDVHFSELHDGLSVELTCIHRSKHMDALQSSVGRRYHSVIKVFSLSGGYKGKADRWSEDVAKARIESRFSDEVRSSQKWSLFASNSSQKSIGILASVFESGPDSSESQRGGDCWPVPKILVETNISKGKMEDNGPSSECVLEVSILDTETVRLRPYIHGKTYASENVPIKDLAAMLNKKLLKIVQLSTQPHNLELAHAYITYHETVAKALPIRRPLEQTQSLPRKLRPISPVKAISSFLGGSLKESSSPTKTVQNLFSNSMPRMAPPEASSLPRPPSFVRPKDENLQNKASLIANSTIDSGGVVEQLEKTLNAFVLAVQSRKGNVVARVLRGRTQADELNVNELYNTLVEDSMRIQAPAEASVDVLFAAFEKFLKCAWADAMGPILSPKLLHDMQAIFDMPRTPQTTERLVHLLGEMTPQNRRIFVAILALLAELLDAAGNDGDRGALIATFTEMLVIEGNPHDYITLFDRLVEDYDLLLDVNSSPAEESSTSRMRAVNTGSLSSNASSLRRRFGFGTLSRENSKKDDDSRPNSVWRSWGSRPNRGTPESSSQPSSLGKSFLSRSRSTDNDVRKALPPRPGSSDRPISSGQRSKEGSPSRPGSAHNALSTLSTIGETPPEKTPSLPRKKRRSSLSDLEPMKSPPPTYITSPSMLRSPTPKLPDANLQRARNSLRTPSPKKPARLPLPTDKEKTPEPPPKFVLQSRKENLPVSQRSTLTERAVNRKSSEVVITGLGPPKKKDAPSLISSPRPKVHERALPKPNASPKKGASISPQKTRLPNLEKAARERIAAEKTYIVATQTALQSELDALSAAISTPSLEDSAVAPLSPTTLSSRSRALQAKIDSTFSSLNARISALEPSSQPVSQPPIFSAQHSVASPPPTTMTQRVSSLESRNANLAALYKETNAENEALYDRFNEELATVLGLVKAGKGEDELKRRLAESEAEVKRLRGVVRGLRGRGLG